jgi:dihydroorotate dehydrogenase (fumarate)
MAPLTIAPPLLNSANPWCTTLAQLRELYASPHTGAVTTRTSLLNGFPHDPAHHQFTFFDPQTLSASQPNASPSTAAQTASLNTLGYSPHPLSDYLSFISSISRELPASSSSSPSLKPFIISVTGPVPDIITCYTLISTLQPTVPMRLAMELNLSCPNIPGAPPPAYDAAALSTYLVALKRAVAATPPSQAHGPVPIGIKTPPYTHHAQYEALLRALSDSLAAEPAGAPCPVDFITATNTLGSALVLSPSGGEGFGPTLHSATGLGIGGLAGAPLHALALGNVVTIRGMLDQHAELAWIQIIGVGGVEGVEGYRRMRAVGAAAVGVGTALGKRGVKVFEDIDGALRARL